MSVNNCNQLILRKVFYFNINYTCNNRCVFCISHNVSRNKIEIAKDEIFKRLNEQHFHDGDYLILNGGEPTIHSQFYQIINGLSNLNLIVKIYSNGLKVDVNKILNYNVEFVIPIHGSERTHDELTRRKWSYQRTLKSLRALNMKLVPFSLKFIISKEMVDENFDIRGFLINNHLDVKEIFLSRMNDSKVAKKNNFTIPDKGNVIRYLKLQYESLKLSYVIKFVDFPRCFLEGFNIDNYYDVNIKPKEEFYFNDLERNMVSDHYKKERLYFDSCPKCNFSAECDLMSDSYYVLSSKDNRVELKLE